MLNLLSHIRNTVNSQQWIQSLLKNHLIQWGDFIEWNTSHYYQYLHSPLWVMLSAYTQLNLSCPPPLRGVTCFMHKVLRPSIIILLRLIFDRKGWPAFQPITYWEKTPSHRDSDTLRLVGPLLCKGKNVSSEQGQRFHWPLHYDSSRVRISIKKGLT